MKTLLTAIGTLSACTATRWFLDSPHRKEKRCAGDRVRLTALWNEGAAFGLKIPKSVLLSLSGAVRRPALVVAPTNVNLGKSKRIDLADAPLPIIISIAKSSIAGYKTSST